MKRFAITVIVFVMIALVVPGAVAQTPMSKVISPESLVYGRSYSEWSAAWEQWADSIPTASHPLFDNGDCGVGQSGPVWFLGGKFCANNATNCGYTGVVRSCKVPAGKSLYVAVLNSEDSVLEENNPNKQINELREFVSGNIDGATNVRFEIDNVPVPNLKNRFRVQSPAFGFTMPDDNFFTAVGEGPYKGGTYYPGVDDGIYVMLAPLSVGPHQIHLHGYFPVWNFTLDVTYQIMVVK
jgi:hypothetical protein